MTNREIFKLKQAHLLVIAFLLLLQYISIPNAALAHEPEKHSEKTILMTATGFEPKEITINQGETITFINNDEGPRWPASNLHPTHSQYPGSGIEKCATDEMGLFDACGPLPVGAEFSFTFEHPGTWQYHDHIRSQLSGQITVEPVAGYVVASKNTSGKQWLDTLTTDIRVWIWRNYYALFPSQIQKQLDSLDMYIIALNEDKLRYWMRIFGSERILEDLIADSNDDQYFGCHLEAHLVGRMAYYVDGVSPLDVFDERCQFGYYHGLLESFLGKEGDDDIVKHMAEKCDSFSTVLEKVQCYHGIGHGLTVYYNYELPKALEACASFGNRQLEFYCNGGLFMENGLTAIEFDTGDGHKSEWVNDDPYFPCTEFTDRREIMSDCYSMQALIMSTHTNFDFSAVQELCDSAPADMIESCYWGSGFFATAPPRRPDLEVLIPLCEHESALLEVQCVLGTIEMLTFVWGKDWEDTAEDFCNAFRPETNEECWKWRNIILGTA